MHDLYSFDCFEKAFGLSLAIGKVSTCDAMASKVAGMWATNETLVSRAGSGRLVLITNGNISRDDVVTNEEVLETCRKKRRKSFDSSNSVL